MVDLASAAESRYQIETEIKKATSMKQKILIAKPGLDGHDRGAKVVAQLLISEGFEVIYTGLHQTPAEIVKAAVEEDAGVIGLSIMSGAHIPLTKKIISLMRENRIGDVPLVIGGVIPEDDIAGLEAIGAAKVFPVGTPFTEITEWFKRG